MHTRDEFFTPEDVAATAVDAITLRRVETVADFAAGKGSLLQAASLKRPNAKFVATDLSRSMVSFLKRRFPGWQVGQCDFLRPGSREQCKAVRRLRGEADLVLLNPPFSYRRAAVAVTSRRSMPFRCSPAAAFVVTSIEYLRPGGQLLCIVPTSTLRSELDAAARDLLYQERRNCGLVAS